jgi:hypothetical protein
MNDNNKIDKNERIEKLKNEARKYNISGNLAALAKVITQLEEIWDDDEAAMAFYTELEERSISKGD